MSCFGNMGPRDEDAREALIAACNEMEAAKARVRHRIAHPGPDAVPFHVALAYWLDQDVSFARPPHALDEGDRP